LQARKEAEEWKPRLDSSQEELFKLEKALEIKVGMLYRMARFWLQACMLLCLQLQLAATEAAYMPAQQVHATALPAAELMHQTGFCALNLAKCTAAWHRP
jgi:hypothetical protein